MRNNSVAQFIDSERKYFAPMKSRANQATEAQRIAWRAETLRQRQERISLEVFDMAQGQVLYGPFKGMKLNRERWWGALDLGSQCLGLYEKEVLDELCVVQGHRSYDLFIDIGAADGYYTTGALHSGLFSNAIAFESSAEGQESIRASWAENGSPGRLTILGEATEQAFLELSSGAPSKALVLIDVEGAEFDILTPAVLAALSQSTLIIEVHNWIDDFEVRYATFLESAFELFQVEIIAPVSRDIHQYQELRDFTDDNRLLLTSERRPCQMRFLKLTPRP